jgi:hypothetical protein
MDLPDDILLALGRLEGKVDALMAQQLRTQDGLDDLDQRVRGLENQRALLIGACTVIATLASYTVSLYT